MGYDLHVTRGDRKPIAETEWRAYVARDPGFDLTGVAETSTPDGTLRYENPGLACWRGHPSGEQVWFDFRRGRFPRPRLPARAVRAAHGGGRGPRGGGCDPVRLAPSVTGGRGQDLPLPLSLYPDQGYLVILFRFIYPSSG